MRYCVLGLLAFAWQMQGDEAAQPDWLSAGRRMVRVVGSDSYRLSGRAPQGRAEDSYFVTNGAEVLWQGKAGESFCVKRPPFSRSSLYLVSPDNRNTSWQDLQWVEGDKKKVPGSKHRDVGAAEKWGLRPGKGDAGPTLRRIISESQCNYHPRYTVFLEKGVYHFYPEGALKLSLYVSNHDQQDISPVGVPLVNLHSFTLDGQGSTFVFHGRMQPFLIMDSTRVELRNITIRYESPNDVEGEITEIKDGKTTLKFSPQFSWKVNHNGRFRILREGGESPVRAALGFEKSGAMVPTSGSGDKGWTDAAEQVSEREVRFNIDASRAGFKPGHILVLRDYARPHPAMMIYRAEDVKLHNIIFRDSQGMALLAQRSQNITIKGGGCIAGQGRVHTASADATHFSNCKGKIKVENATYEGMMDDAINVHSTCLSIEQIESPTQLIVRYVHHQSVGFEVFRPGEKVQFIAGPTLENIPSLGEVRAVEKLDETHLRLTLVDPVPDEIGVGDAVENADWYPSVTFKNNIVRYNRARGCLFTTPKPVLVEGNQFIRSHGSAILLAGDAQGWYESGRCLDVKILNNLFDHNLTARYQFTEAVISIYPEVRQLSAQQEPYHRNILIEGNTFLTHRVPLLYMRSADDIVWRNNKVTYDDKYSPRRNGAPFVFDGSKPKNAQLPTTP